MFATALHLIKTVTYDVTKVGGEVMYIAFFAASNCKVMAYVC